MVSYVDALGAHSNGMLVEVGQEGKETTVDSLIDLLAGATQLPVSTAVSASPTSLSLDVFLAGYLFIFTGSFGAADIQLPTHATRDVIHAFLVENNTNGALTFVADNADSTNLTVDVAVGEIAILHYDGTDVNKKLSSTSASSIGKHTVNIPAAAMQPRISNGCGSLLSSEISADQPNITYLPFDGTDSGGPFEEHSQFSFTFPKSWDAGTITYKVKYSHDGNISSGVTGLVTFGLKAVAISGGGSQNVSFGTAVTVSHTDPDGNQSFETSESAALTIGGSPSKGDKIYFDFYTDVGSGNRDLNTDIRVEEVIILYNTDAETDA